MGVALSLPVMGYFLMPSLTSYSTSLNLLFFYITWSTLVLSQPPLKVEIVSTLGIRALFFLLPSLIFLGLDSIVPSISVNFKTQGSQALPASTRGGRSRRASKWYNVVGLSLFNIFLSTAIQACVELLFTEVFGFRSALKITTTLPMPWSIVKDVGRGLILREIFQYYVHRYILHPPSPNYLSKLHQSYFHSITAPYSFTAHYDHPLPYLVWRFLPTYFPSVLFRVHLLTYLLLLSIITIEETLAMSGYASVPGIILGGIARRQDLHSEGHGKGNFSPYGLLDWLHGTGIGPDVIDDVRDEAEKHHVKDRGGKAFENVKESGVKAWNRRKKSSKNS